MSLAGRNRRRRGRTFATSGLSREHPGGLLLRNLRVCIAFWGAITHIAFFRPSWFIPERDSDKKKWETWRLFHISLSVSMGVRARALDSIVSLMSIRDTIVTIYSFTFASPLSRYGLSLYLPISVRRELSRHFIRSWLALSSYFSLWQFSFSCNLCPCRLTGDDSLIHSGLLFPARIQFT